MSVVYWPRDLLKPRHAAINPAPATVAGPASLSGFRQAVASPAGVWAITYDTIAVASAVQRKVFRALAAQIEGRITPIVLPVYDRADLRPVGAVTTAAADVSHSDGANHDDGTGYAHGRIHATVQQAVARSATQMTIDMHVGAGPEPGQHVSIGLRLYRIKSIVNVTGNRTTCTFWPPAREDILAGAECEFDKPVCKVRLIDDAGLDLTLDTGRHGFPSITFIEDPT